jgi:hypothetical protein
MDALGVEPALHPQPEQVELGVMGDDAGLLQDRLERSEVVAGGAEVDGPDGAAVTAEGEQADFALPRVESVALALAVGLDVERDAGGTGQVEGDAVEVGAEGAKNRVEGLSLNNSRKRAVRAAEAWMVA